MIQNVINKYVKAHFTQEASFNHKLAQSSEYEFSKSWQDLNYLALSEKIKTAKKTGKIDETRFSNEFFRSEKNLLFWKKFVNHTKNRTCLEIGTGPVPDFLGWYWLQKPILLDPLIIKYRNYQLEKFHQTLIKSSIKLIPKKAEEFIPSLSGKITGMIYTRNALDHLEDPLLVLNNISRYAAKGCYLLYWSDLWHLNGHDEGHRNITHSVNSFKALIEGLGFKILYDLPKVRIDNSTIQYGCRAVKKT